MKRLFGALAVGVLAVGAARAHFAFVVPDAEGKSAKLVFSDTPDPDTKVDIEKLAGTKLTVRDAGGKDTAIEMKKGEGFYSLALPGTGPRTAFGVADFGVRQKGDEKPFRLIYYPKAVIGVGDSKAVGGVLKAEILQVGSVGKAKFQVLADGKPLADAEVTVLVPGEPKKAVKTDKDGLTEAFAPSGRYGVFARYTEAKPGEHAGMKFTGTRHYATLVVDVK
jgi:uncharacterized GH25 family protein